MRHRLRERPKAAAAGARSRRRERRSRVMAPKETPVDCDGAVLSELNELLSADEAAPWWKEEDSSLTELLEQLVGTEDSLDAQRGPEEAASSATGPEALHPMATRGRGAGNKNAVAARLNRLRKKEYVSGLEHTVSRLSEDNARLEQERKALGARVHELESEARYLRAVLANDSALSQLLSRLTGLGGVKLSTSLFRDPYVKADDHDYALPGLARTVEPEEEEAGAPSAGVCLHVDKEKVSVEFCPACARSAAASAKIFSFR
ncbi:CREB/ATF bZIP transcription factor isoform 1-T2 [Anomaloglossus baeobatrachus]|uniref:CREB/ATF bZIP transcription factor n=1 Tax=Anomaloglossus baeobatrachus TaxID=238106 RepID=UPI003F509013